MNTYSNCGAQASRRSCHKAAFLKTFSLWLQGLVLVCGYTALLPGAWAQKLDAAPALEVGDRWTYKFTNIGDKRDPYTFTLQAAEITTDSVWVHGETTDPNANDKKYVWRYDIKRAGFLERFRWDDAAPNKRGLRTADAGQKSDDFYQFPLEVGKKWAVKDVWNNGQGHTNWKAEVTAFEKVTTQAGEFDAFKIQYRGFWNRTVDGNFSGRAEQDRWYAPAAKGIVKSAYNDRNGAGLWNQNTSELVKWEPNSAAAVAGAPGVGQGQGLTRRCTNYTARALSRLS